MGDTMERHLVMKQIQVKLQNGENVSALVEKVGTQFWIKAGDQTWAYDIADLSSDGQRRKKSQTATPDMIMAPMPGKITKVFVKDGDLVTKGQALLVMEAMKMEYTLKSDFETKVEKVNIKANDQVTVGALLVKLQKENTDLK